MESLAERAGCVYLQRKMRGKRGLVWGGDVQESDGANGELGSDG